MPSSPSLVCIVSTGIVRAWSFCTHPDKRKMTRERLQENHGFNGLLHLLPVSTPAKHPSWLYSGKGCLPRSLFPRVKHQMTKCQTGIRKQVTMKSSLPFTYHWGADSFKQALWAHPLYGQLPFSNLSVIVTV